MGTRYMVEYLGLGVERDFAAAFTASVELAVATSIDRNLSIAQAPSIDLTAAMSLHLSLRAGLSVAVELAVALSIVEGAGRRRRRGILVEGACT